MGMLMHHTLMEQERKHLKQRTEVKTDKPTEEVPVEDKPAVKRQSGRRKVNK